MNNKPLIALWGSPGSGKTVTTIKLAQAFATKRKNVLILFCDALCPSISTIVPQAASQQKSLGELMSLPSLTQEDLLRYALPLEGSPYIGLIGYKQGDTAFSYASYERERGVDLLTLARHSADVVLVDCASYLSADPLSTIALEMADTVFRLHTCDLKSLMFYSSYLPLLTDARFRRLPHVHVLSNVKPGQDSREYSQVFGDMKVTLPYLSAIEQQVFAARLLDSLSSKGAAAYESSIQQMMAFVLPDESQPPTPKPPAQKQPCKKTRLLTRHLPKRRGDRT